MEVKAIKRTCIVSMGSFGVARAVFSSASRVADSADAPRSCNSFKAVCASAALPKDSFVTFMIETGRLVAMLV